MKIQKDYSWIKGFNYVPSSAHNDIEFWRDYDMELIERELGFAKRLGLNCARPFLSYVVYKDHPEKFIERLLHFVHTAYSMGIYTMPVVWDSCFSEDEPQITANKNQWFANPGTMYLKERFWSEQEEYCKELIRALSDEPGLLMWDIHNEPLMSSYVHDYDEATSMLHQDEIWTFVRHFCGFFKENDPNNPVTVGIHTIDHVELIGGDCDVLSFHDYSPSETEMECIYHKALQFSESLGKPILCSENCCTARANPYDVAIEVAMRNRIGFFLWELMVGESFWNDRHGIVYPDGTIRDPAAVAAIRGFFRNRGESKKINLDVEGIVTATLAMDLKPEKKLLQRMANLLECGELVPMCVLPSSLVQSIDFTSPEGIKQAEHLIEEWSAVLRQTLSCE